MEPTPAEPPSVPARSGRSPRDMALSMVVLLIPIAILIGMFRYLGNERPPTIDAAPAFAAARTAKEFAVLEPAVPTGWQVQSAQYRRENAGGTLRLGLRTSEGGPMQLVETAAPPASLIPAELGDKAREQGTVEVGGRPWQRYGEGRPGERALVLVDQGRTILVYGSVPESDLATLASALR
ncbi:MAG TPA: DUF4245 domain-containing protein [Micromonosporaceae bacterium]|nr:DUF4245 domain-containing protein [Micromonosporaceae bacterium]